MARARLNWIDLHGTWDVSVTDAPNLYAYFIQSDQFPKVGVAPEIKAANLRRLNTIIRMAHARGVRVSLMAYEARFRTPHAPAPYPENEADLYAYTREVVEKLIRQAPGLDAIGFRIGESGHGEAFFNCYLEAVKASGRDIPLVTRSWLARKSRVVPLAKASRDFTVEIKYNGEQWGAPYMLMGGRMAGWYSYSFEDYLSDSGAQDSARLWPGNPAPGGGTWPAEPYKIVWQVRANGTHRILPVYDPAAVRMAVRSMPLGTASGFVVEGLETYYPKSPALLSGRSGRRLLRLDPRAGLDVSQPLGEAGLRSGHAGRSIRRPGRRQARPGRGVRSSRPGKRPSRIVSTAFSAFSLGPDHRNHAIELEWGGDTAGLPGRGALRLPCLRLDPGNGRPETRPAASTAASRPRPRPPGCWPSPPRPRKLPRSRPPPFRPGRRSASRSSSRPALRPPGSAAITPNGSWPPGGRARRKPAPRTRRARPPGTCGKRRRHWAGLAASTYYKPFTERLRMRTNAFHWSLRSCPRSGPRPSGWRRSPHPSPIPWPNLRPSFALRFSPWIRSRTSSPAERSRGRSHPGLGPDQAASEQRLFPQGSHDPPGRQIRI